MYIYIYIYICETKGWLILILMIIKQGLKLMIIFQVWLGKTISKVAITKTNHAKEKSWRRRPPQMIQEKLGLNGALKICKFWNNDALKKYSSKAQI